jgi:DNA-binding CsgD family transcriptional regulator
MAQPDLAPAQQPQEAPVACPLSEREMEILAGVAEGCSNKEIGRRCGISDQTVKNHLTAVLRKLEVTDRTEAVVIALRNRWLRLESIKIGNSAAAPEVDDAARSAGSRPATPPAPRAPDRRRG